MLYSLRHSCRSAVPPKSYWFVCCVCSWAGGGALALFIPTIIRVAMRHASPWGGGGGVTLTKEGRGRARDDAGSRGERGDS